MDKEKTYRDSDLGILIELHKTTPETGRQLQQHRQHFEDVSSELGRLAGIRPKHKYIGMGQPAYELYVAAIKQAAGFNQTQFPTVLGNGRKATDYKLAHRQKEDNTVVEEWTE